jgi:hypothetical protein
VVIVPLRLNFYVLHRRLGHLFNELGYKIMSMLCDKQLKYSPGDPPNLARAGITVLGGTIELSSILAQSLIIVNLPYTRMMRCVWTIPSAATHDDTVLSDINVISDRRCFYYRPGADVDVIANLHGIVVEVASIGFIGRSSLQVSINICMVTVINTLPVFMYSPHYTPFTDQAIPPQRNHHRRARSRPS